MSVGADPLPPYVFWMHSRPLTTLLIVYSTFVLSPRFESRGNADDENCNENVFVAILHPRPHLPRSRKCGLSFLVFTAKISSLY
jgi:hypothetical protein